MTLIGYYAWLLRPVLPNYRFFTYSTPRYFLDIACLSLPELWEMEKERKIKM